MMICKNCGSDNVNVQALALNKRRGCVASLLWFILGVFTFGLLWIIPLISKKGSKVKGYAVCQSCGYKWKV